MLPSVTGTVALITGWILDNAGLRASHNRKQFFQLVGSMAYEIGQTLAQKFGLLNLLHKLKSQGMATI